MDDYAKPQSNPAKHSPAILSELSIHKEVNERVVSRRRFTKQAGRNPKIYREIGNMVNENKKGKLLMLTFGYFRRWKDHFGKAKH